MGDGRAEEVSVRSVQSVKSVHLAAVAFSTHRARCGRFAGSLFASMFGSVRVEAFSELEVSMSFRKIDELSDDAVAMPLVEFPGLEIKGTERRTSAPTLTGERLRRVE